MVVVQNKANLPHGIEYDGKKMGVGYPNFHNVMKYHFDIKSQSGNWSYQYTHDKPSKCKCCGK